MVTPETPEGNRKGNRRPPFRLPITLVGLADELHLTDMITESDISS